MTLTNQDEYPPFNKLSIHVVSEGTTLILFAPADNYLPKVNNRNTRARCEIFSKLTIKTPERHH